MTDRPAAQQRQPDREREALLRAELQHSVRNMLAIVRSIFSRTVAAGESLEDVANHFTGRLDVLARYQLRRTQEPGNAVDLETMIRDELDIYRSASDPRVSLGGPEIWIGHDAAQLIGLAIHELVTNSIKYGALSSSDPRAGLAIGWTLTDATLRLEWCETGIAVLAPAPVRAGFGREFLEQALPYQLGGSGQFEMRPGEIRWLVEIPTHAAHDPKLQIVRVKDLDER